MFVNLIRKGKSALSFLALAIILLALGSLSNQNSPTHSVEVAIAEQSPAGAESGFVVPASCNSYEHTPGECTEYSQPYYQSYYQNYYQGAYPTPPTFSCSPTTVSSGGAVTCTWSDPLGRSCDGIGLSAGGASSGSVVVNPTVTTTYGVQCDSDQTTASVTVVSPTLTITATPSRVRSGSASSISWRAASVTSCTLTGTGVNTSCSGLACANANTTATGALTAQSIFTLSCQTAVGAQSVTATVSITPSVCEVGTVGCPNN